LLSSKAAANINEIVMGDIPSFTNMISTIILSPTPGQILPPSRDITIKVYVQNLAPGHFTAPLKTYFTAPQSLSPEGLVAGHVHVTVQDMGSSLTPMKPLDASKFVFFKGINDNGNGQGEFQTTITGGLPKGFYRVCTMNAAMNHQPVLMPVGQRGAQDDCQKFVVGGADPREDDDDAKRRGKEEEKEAHIAKEGERARRGKGRAGDGRRVRR
jgi:transcription initiation factor TFIID subunit 15